MTSQDNITIEGGGKVVGGDDNSMTITTHNLPVTKTKLSTLFECLKHKFETEEQTNCISEELRRYQTDRDTIGLEQKLIDGDLEYLYEDASLLKEAYTKKLYRYQFYEPAQEIHVLILGQICQKFRYLIYPLIRKGEQQDIISKIISYEIVDPIMQTIQENGCDDIMGLTPNDIEGMIYFLTGRCHIKWKL